MKNTLMMIAVMFVLGAFAADTNIDWQFTGATNRAASVSRVCAVNEYIFPPTAVAFDVPYFDSLLPGWLALSGLNLNTTGLGFILVFQ